MFEGEGWPGMEPRPPGCGWARIQLRKATDGRSSVPCSPSPSNLLHIIFMQAKSNESEPGNGDGGGGGMCQILFFCFILAHLRLINPSYHAL